MQGIQNYVKDVINKYCDKTYTGLITAITDDGYTVSINGIEYPNVDTIGGTCTLNETVRVLVPQGSFSNMFIIKGGSGSSGSTVTTGVTSVNGLTGDVTLDASDVGAISTSENETTDIDFSNYFTE